SSSAHWQIVSLCVSFIGMCIYVPSFIKVLLKSFELTSLQNATLPPSSPETGSITDQLYKRSSNRVNSYTQTVITTSGIYANQQSIKQNRQKAIRTEQTTDEQQSHP